MTRLTSVANVKRYLAITTTPQDALIDRLIVSESNLIEKHVGRRFPYVVNTGVRRNGTGTASLVLPDQPIIGVDSLAIGTLTIPASADGVGPGFVFDDTTIYLLGGQKFAAGFQNVLLTWRAGYQTTQADTVPTANTPTLSPSDVGFAHTDRGVTYTGNSVALTAVANAPVAGQYSFDEGVYTFNASDSGNGVTMAFDYVPAAVEQACIEMVGLDLKQRDNIGISSKSLAGESISYEKTGMPASVKELLNPFKQRCPV